MADRNQRLSNASEKQLATTHLCCNASFLDFRRKQAAIPSPALECREEEGGGYYCGVAGAGEQRLDGRALKLGCIRANSNLLTSFPSFSSIVSPPASSA